MNEPPVQPKKESSVKLKARSRRTSGNDHAPAPRSAFTRSVTGTGVPYCHMSTAARPRRVPSIRGVTSGGTLDDAGMRDRISYNFNYMNHDLK